LNLNGDDEFPYDEHGRKPNLNKAFIHQLETTFNKQFMTDFMPEDVFYYAYAILHSPTYRKRYADFLKIDYPRLPIVTGFEFFMALAKQGHILVQWHMMEHPNIRPPKHIAVYPIPRADEVDGLVEEEHIRYDEQNGRVYINPDQYFEGITPDVWDFYVGGYQILDSWFRERLGQQLAYTDIMDYQRIVWISMNTIEIMDDIDRILGESLLFEQLAD
ncbi:MAG: hypothetical protein MUE54_15380, partial [Anaerolineae bacterium]|nr:hypothetical protein [Anaerolineae bacterium]